VTFFGLFLTPVFYVVIRKLTVRTTPTTQTVAVAEPILSPMLDPTTHEAH